MFFEDPKSKSPSALNSCRFFGSPSNIQLDKTDQSNNSNHNVNVSRIILNAFESNLATEVPTIEAERKPFKEIKTGNFMPSMH